MNSRIDEIILGIVVILLGIFVAISGGFRLEPKDMLIMAIGLGFLLMFKTKKESWALVVGCYLLCLGIEACLARMNLKMELSLRVRNFLEGNIMLFATGAIFTILFYEKNKRGLLVPGCLILGVFVINFFRGVLLISENYLSFFVFSLCFYIIYVNGRYFLGSWPKYCGFVLFLIGTLRLLS